MFFIKAMLHWSCCSSVTKSKAIVLFSTSVCKKKVLILLVSFRPKFSFTTGTSYFLMEISSYKVMATSLVSIDEFQDATLFQQLFKTFNPSVMGCGRRWKIAPFFLGKTLFLQIFYFILLQNFYLNGKFVCAGNHL